MEVKVAGFTLDSELTELLRRTIEEFRYGSAEDRSYLFDLLKKLADEPLTPEPLSSAFSRVSTSSVPLSQLRQDARASLNRTRQTNKKLTEQSYICGIGTYSNICLEITGISSLTALLLSSFTNLNVVRSRFNWNQKFSYYLPDSNLKKESNDRIINYFNRLEDLAKKIITGFNEQDEQSHWYGSLVLPLATNLHVGISTDIHTAYLMGNSLLNNSIKEIHELGVKIQVSLRKLAPSLEPIYYEDTNVISELKLTGSREDSNETGTIVKRLTLITRTPDTPNDPMKWVSDQDLNDLNQLLLIRCSYNCLLRLVELGLVMILKLSLQMDLTRQQLETYGKIFHGEIADEFIRIQNELQQTSNHTTESEGEDDCIILTHLHFCEAVIKVSQGCKKRIERILFRNEEPEIILDIINIIKREL